MTREQWFRSVDLLEQELALTGQPRAVVLHNKDGKDHLHVVWQRTDLETMKFISDSQNYAAHERVSQILEQEFGHQPVPGKHAKREKKPVDEETRARDLHMKETVTRLYQHSDTAQAFKTALEEEGYVLAKGDRRPHIVVDADGKEHSLSRCLPDLTPKQIREFMAAIDRNALPTVDEAKAIQREAAKAPAQNQPPPAPEPPPEPPKPQPQPNAEQLAKLETALKNRHDLETHQLVQQQQAEQKRVRQDLDRIKEEKVFELRALHKETLDQYDREHARTPLKEKLAALWAWFAPAKEENRRRERAEYYVAKREELDQQIKALKTPIYKEEAAMAARHAQQLADHQRRFEEDRARHLREQELALLLISQMEQQRLQEKLIPQPTPPPDHLL
jgi:hypothetical protein